jgi:hypothetical protein
MVWAFFAIGGRCVGACTARLYSRDRWRFKKILQSAAVRGSRVFLIGVLVPLGALGSRGMTGFSQKGVTVRPDRWGPRSFGRDLHHSCVQEPGDPNLRDCRSSSAALRW